MKSKIIFLLILMAVEFLEAMEFSHWEDITDGIGSGKFVNLRLINNDYLLLSSENALYISGIEKIEWQMTFSINQEEKIVDAIGVKNKIFIATKHKIYSGDLSRKNFTEIFSINNENEITALGVSASQNFLYAGTKKGLWAFELDGTGKKNLIMELKNITCLTSHPFEPGVIFVGTDSGLYKVSKNLKEVKSLYNSISRDYSKINSIAISKANDNILFIATDAGIIRMRLKDKEFRDIKLDGKITIVEVFETKPELIVAVGEKDIFYSSDGIERWTTVTNIIPFGIPKAIRRSSSENMFLLTDYGIYRQNEKNLGSVSIKKLEETFTSEPTIEEMERSVLKTYMLDRNIIKRWRRNSRVKALLPEIDVGVSIGIDRDYDLDVGDTIYTSSSTGKFFIGPDERKLSESRGRDLSYGIKLSWNLPDSIFNSNELSVSNEAEDVLDLRYRVLSELRRIYFERRRLIAEYNFFPPQDEYKKFELKNRIDELTANLDMLSDGYFSKAIKVREKN